MCLVPVGTHPAKLAGQLPCAAPGQRLLEQEIAVEQVIRVWISEPGLVTIFTGTMLSIPLRIHYGTARTPPLPSIAPFKV